MVPSQSTAIPDAFTAYEELAAYVNADLSRSKAITEARDCHWDLVDMYTRAELRARKVWLCPIAGEQAAEFFDGEFDSGWIEVTPTNDAQRANLIRMWKVEPRP